MLTTSEARETMLTLSCLRMLKRGMPTLTPLHVDTATAVVCTGLTLLVHERGYTLGRAKGLQAL
jgi:hypothetical protein